MRAFPKADKELSDFYTTAIGIRAVNYDPRLSSGIPDVEMMQDRNLRDLAFTRKVFSTLEKIDLEFRSTIQSMYEPRGTPGFLAHALAPRTGSGSFVTLALTLDVVTNAFRKKHPTGTDVLGFLVEQAGRGKNAEPFFRDVLTACEELREKALAAYDVAMRARLDDAESTRKQLLDDVLAGNAERRATKQRRITGRA